MIIDIIHTGDEQKGEESYKLTITNTERRCRATGQSERCLRA